MIDVTISNIHLDHRGTFHGFSCTGWGNGIRHLGIIVLNNMTDFGLVRLALAQAPALMSFNFKVTHDNLSFGLHPHLGHMFQKVNPEWVTSAKQFGHWELIRHHEVNFHEVEHLLEDQILKLLHGKRREAGDGQPLGQQSGRFAVSRLSLGIIVGGKILVP